MQISYLKVAGILLVVFIIGAAVFVLNRPVVKAPVVSAPTATYASTTRTYYIAAENVMWDYAPGGVDLMKNEPIPQPWGAQTKYNKVRYIEYTDDTFTVKKPQPTWLGILGPVIRAVEGDTIKVVFYNKADKSYSMHPHGVIYDRDNEGAPQSLGGKGSSIKPGEKYTYTWFATNESAPRADEGGSKVWWYHSHVDSIQDLYDGLLGPLTITAAKYGKPDATPTDIDKEFVTMFMIFDESKPGMTAVQKEGSMKHTINGYVFDTLPGLVMNKGDRVRWHLLGMGNEVDIHTPHWHGELVLNRETNTYTDVVELLSGSMHTVDMLATNPGTWMYHCHVFDHIKAGMISMYTINP